MLYDYLYEFTVVARESSFTRAALKLGISQPALGRHMSALETHLGAKLVVRGPRGISLTPDGRYVLNRALDACSICEAIDMHFKGHGGGLRQVLVAGVTDSTTAQSSLAKAALMVGRPESPLELRYQMGYSPLSIADALEAPEADIVITMRSGLESEDLDSERFHIVRLFDSGGVAIVEPESPLASLGESMDIRELSRNPVGRMDGHQGNSDLQWRELLRSCARYGFTPTSWTVGFDYVPGWGDWHLPNCVVVFNSETHDFAALERAGKVVIPIEGLVYEFYGIARADDVAACQLLDNAAQQARSEKRP